MKFRENNRIRSSVRNRVRLGKARQSIKVQLEAYIATHFLTGSPQSSRLSSSSDPCPISTDRVHQLLCRYFARVFQVKESSARLNAAPGYIQTQSGTPSRSS